MVVRSKDQVMKLVLSQVLEDEEASIQALQTKLVRNRENLAAYQETAAIVLERLLESYPNACVMSFRREYRGTGWQMSVANLTNVGAVDKGAVGLAESIVKELGANTWLRIYGPSDSV